MFVYMCRCIPYFFDQKLRLLFMSLLLLCDYYLRAAFIFGKPGDINNSWISMSETVMVARRCQ